MKKFLCRFRIFGVLVERTLKIQNKKLIFCTDLHLNFCGGSDPFFAAAIYFICFKFGQIFCYQPTGHNGRDFAGERKSIFFQQYVMKVGKWKEGQWKRLFLYQHIVLRYNNKNPLARSTKVQAFAYFAVHLSHDVVESAHFDNYEES